MSDLQIQLYCHYLEHFTKSGCAPSGANQNESAGLFSDFQELARIWTHPKALLLASRRRGAKTTITKTKVSKAKGAKKKSAKSDDFDDDYLLLSDNLDGGITN